MIVWLIILVVSGCAVAIHFCIVAPSLAYVGPQPALDDNGRELALRLETHVRAIASVPHNLAHPEALQRAASYIEHTLLGFGYTPHRQIFFVGGKSVCNIEIIIPAFESHSNPQTLVIGAHYDSPDDSPGANDNGTGVAALLELAALLPNTRPSVTLRLVFFVNEESPYGKTPDMGSYQHAKLLRDQGVPVIGMIALETLGHFSDTLGSQRFPFPFGWFYSNRGNFAAVVGMPRARKLVFRSVKAFRATSSFPIIGGVAPGFIDGIDLSDHWAYNHFGFPACMVTDTAPFRNPFYHTTFDTPDTVDYPNLARVTVGLHTMILHLVAQYR